MSRTDNEEPKTPSTLTGMVEETRRVKMPCCPPAIDPALQLKWGLALLGEEKAKEYLRWLQMRLDDSR